VVTVVAAAGYWWTSHILRTPNPDNGGGDVAIEISRGMSLGEIAALLESERLLSRRQDFKWAAYLVGAEKKLQPGRYLLPRGATNAELLRLLLRPGLNTITITIPEGLTCRQIAGIFQRALRLDSARFEQLTEDSAFAAELEVPASRLEGYLFPDTYEFYFNDGATAVLRRMVGHFFQVFNDALQQRARDAGLTLHQAVTLASIIQGEIMVADEAPLVSAVYHNRLKRRIPLAADPTIQYIIPDGPRRLLTKDLELDSPYNTYKHAGLPPGPINNPGRAALEAAVNPAEVDYLYFVAVGDGSHSFNSTLEAHNRAKAKFQQVRKQIAVKNKIGG
jgi:UPF0755 protein